MLNYLSNGDKHGKCLDNYQQASYIRRPGLRQTATSTSHSRLRNVAQTQRDNNSSRTKDKKLTAGKCTEPHTKGQMRGDSVILLHEVSRGGRVTEMKNREESC